MLIEVRVQLNGTLRQDIDRVASAIRVAKTGLRYSSQNFASCTAALSWPRELR